MKTGSTEVSEYSSEEFALPDYADDVKELTEDDDITVLKVQPMKEPMRAQVKQHSLKKQAGVQSKRAKRRERRALEKIIKKNLKTNRVWLRKQTVRLPIETLVRLQEAQKKKIDDIAKERHCKTCSVKDILSMGVMVSISVSDPDPDPDPLAQKNIVMSFKPYTEKSKKKKIGICSILGRIRIHHPGSGSVSF